MFQSFGAVELKKILKWYRNNLSEDSSITAECEWLHFKHAVIKLKDQNQGIPPFDLFSTIISQQKSLHLISISKVLKIMLDILPSNAHNSVNAHTFNADQYIHHWLQESKRAGERKLVLEGVQILSIFRLGGKYSTRTTKDKDTGKITTYNLKQGDVQAQIESASTVRDNGSHTTHTHTLGAIKQKIAEDL